MSEDTNFFCSYLDEYQSDCDDLGAVGKLRVASPQRYQDRRNPIDIRRLDRLRPKTAQIAVPLIVGENNDEIGLGSVEGSRSKQKRGQDTGFKKVNWFHGGQFPANPLLRQST